MKTACVPVCPLRFETSKRGTAPTIFSSPCVAVSLSFSGSASKKWRIHHRRRLPPRAPWRLKSRWCASDGFCAAVGNARSASSAVLLSFFLRLAACFSPLHPSSRLSPSSLPRFSLPFEGLKLHKHAALMSTIVHAEPLPPSHTRKATYEQANKNHTQGSSSARP